MIGWPSLKSASCADSRPATTTRPGSRRRRAPRLWESLFTGMEGVLKLVLGAVGEKVLSASMDGQHNFHAQLIAQAALPTASRPSVISDELHKRLDDLRKFRHLERNVYGEVLDQGKVEDKVKGRAGGRADVQGRN